MVASSHIQAPGHRKCLLTRGAHCDTERRSFREPEGPGSSTRKGFIPMRRLTPELRKGAVCRRRETGELLRGCPDCKKCLILREIFKSFPFFPCVEEIDDSTIGRDAAERHSRREAFGIECEENFGILHKSSKVLYIFS